MQSYETLISEALEFGTPRAKYERLMQLLEKEKELAKLHGWMQVYKTTYESLKTDTGNQTLSEVINFLPEPIK